MLITSHSFATRRPQLSKADWDKIVNSVDGWLPRRHADRNRGPIDEKLNQAAYDVVENRFVRGMPRWVHGVAMHPDR